MKLPDALKGVRQLGFDTPPLIYLVERHADYFDCLLFIMRAVDQGSIEGLTSTISLTEVLVQPLRKGSTDLVRRYEAVLTQSKNFRVESFTPKTARLAADLRARYNVRTPDAMQVATALEAGCDAFVTNDKDLRRVTEIAVWIVDDLELPPPST